ncbi:uncharacterized mitochondrial protein AtMg00300-like [Rutidosis leptorrhynchoides]|uniref:uncharacterized mitochondrial protein AtMg00300-like n=1 Tax=Rutidosis leptorrhynchoides TaxID=125765 RepID=UPI003A992195
MELHGMLKTAESNMTKAKPTTTLLAIREGGIKKKKIKVKGKDKGKGHINKKGIVKLQSDGILEPFDVKTYDECDSCLLGKMTKAPFKGNSERGKDLLELVHTDVCGPFRSPT